MERQAKKATENKAKDAALDGKITAAEEVDAKTNGAGNGAANGEALEAMVKANEAMLQGLVAMQRELMEFGNARLRQDLETQEVLSHCSDLQEAYRVQAEFAQKAMQHYAQETAKLIELSTKIGCECWGPLEDASRAAMKNFAAR